MVMVKARDWTLERVREEAEAIWSLDRRERLDLGDEVSANARKEALRLLIENATKEGFLDIEDIREVLRSVAARTLLTRTA